MPSNDTSAFTAALPQSTFLPGSPEYNTASRYWTEVIAPKPSCFFIPKTSEKLAQGLQQLLQLQIPFSVKGGGHTTNRGWASTDDGVVISTSELKGLDLVAKSEDAGTILRAGIGVTLTEIYNYLDGKGITIVVGNQATPGLGGLLTGGGTGPYWNRHGYAVNAIASRQVVVANGEILEVNATSHPDLFWALKGGLCNFGIVTRIDFQTFPIENMYAGAYIVSPGSHDAAFDAFDAFTAAEGDNPNAQVILQSPAAGTLMASLFYDGPHDSEDVPDVFQKMSAVPRVNSTFKRTNWQGLRDFSFQIAPYGFRRYASTTTIQKDTRLFQRLFELYQTSGKEELGNIEGGQFQIFGHVMTTASHAKNRNGPWAIKDGTGDLIGIMQLSTWKHEKDDERVMRWTERISEEMKHAAKSEDKLHKYLYVNNVDETQDAFASYEPENLERMRTVSKRYDPDGVFQKLRSGGPKLWK